MKINSSNLYFANARSPGFTATSRVVGALAVAAFVAATASATHAALLANGSFETGDSNGWTVTGNAGVGNNPAYGSTDGTYAVVFHSGDSNPPPAKLEQGIATLLGQKYSLSFDLGAYGDVLAESMTVSVLGNGGLSIFTQPVSVTTYSYSTTWNHYDFEFTANSTLSTLVFQETTADGSGMDGVFDNVKVEPIPEPTAELMVLLSAMAYAVSRRRLVV